MPSHISFEAIVQRIGWPTNALTNLQAMLPNKQLCQVASVRILKTWDKLSSLILSRLVDVIHHVAPDNVCLGSTLLQEHVKPKAELVCLWAREAEHSLDSKFRCVKCGLTIDMSKNAEYLKLVLHMKCMGGAGLKPH